MAYHEVPPDVLENVPELTDWARKAIQVAGVKLNARKPRRSNQRP
jgi:TfoX/Sxy family transcriptional regulator of competence genes